jgi:hypothetical protein
VLPPAKKLLIPEEEIGGIALTLTKLIISHHDLVTRHFGNDVAKVFFQRATEFFLYSQTSFPHFMPSTAANRQQVVSLKMSCLPDDGVVGGEYIVRGVPDFGLMINEDIFLIGEVF